MTLRIFRTILFLYFLLLFLLLYLVLFILLFFLLILSFSFTSSSSYTPPSSPHLTAPPPPSTHPPPPPHFPSFLNPFLCLQCLSLPISGSFMFPFTVNKLCLSLLIYNKIVCLLHIMIVFFPQNYTWSFYLVTHFTCLLHTMYIGKLIMIIIMI